MEIKPCPFCGEKPKIFGGDTDVSYAALPYWLQCGSGPEKCKEFPVTEDYNTEEVAIKAWNNKEFDID